MSVENRWAERYEPSKANRERRPASPWSDGDRGLVGDSPTQNFEKGDKYQDCATCNGAILKIMNIKLALGLIAVIVLVATYFLWYKKKEYVSRDKTTCARVYFVCSPGKKQFTDEIGCGCQ